MEPSLIVIGVNFKSAPAAARERFLISESRRQDALQSLVRSEGIDEAIVLATDERTEFIVWASDAALAANSVLRFLARDYDLKLSEWSNFYRLLDEDALLHVFRVAATLDSSTEDEPDIERAVMFAWEAARQAGTTGRFLDAVMQKALSVVVTVQDRSSQPGNEAEGVLREEAQGFRRKLLAEQVVPTIVALRNRLDEICRQELANLGEEFGPFTEDQRQALSKLASHITQRIAGGLARELKELPEANEQELLTTAVQRLFHLEMRSRAGAD